MENTIEIKQKITDLALRKIVENMKCERKKQKMSPLNLTMAMRYEAVNLIYFIEVGIKNQRFNLIYLISIVKILDISILELLEGANEILQTK
ncbi:hypothetical protein BSPLISOX_2743 [uncultured Gammaproteobacteria bacterium]|jgi:hypothetical protein|nr:hypothetical protein BSPLISOX_2743 [uncultured Gammaproteobacteria bacterium]